MPRTRIAVALVTLGLASSHAAAALVSAVSATTTMGSGLGTNLNNTINGMGLSSLSLGATHAGSAPNNSWVSTAPALTGDVTFNLGGTFPIVGFSFWNQNGGGPGPNGSTGINGVIVLGSTNGVVFNPIPGAPGSFLQQPTNLNVAPQVVSFPAVNVSHIRFQILSNWGDTAQSGFAEVQFNAVPAPATTGLLALSFAAFARRRR